MNYITSEIIKELRQKQHMTQKELADLLSVSDKTVSKWETGKGLPDIGILEDLCRVLNVSMAELFSGQLSENRNRSGNMKKAVFYVCPVCGNVIMATGEGSFSCCGIQLPPLAHESETDDAHKINIEIIEHDFYITFNHPMTKEHYISFVAYVTGDKIEFRKLYPEQNPELRIQKRGRGFIYAYCNRDGLFRVLV